MNRHLVLAALALGTILVACGKNDPLPPDATPPGRVSDLTVKSVITNVITLRWTTPGDNGTEGTAASYQVRWSPEIITEDKFESAKLIPDPPLPAAPGTIELFAVPNMDITQVIHFALRTFDETGHVSEISNDCLWTPGGLPIQYFVDIPTSKDNTIYSEADSLSNGSGQFLFAGKTATTGLTRRALLAFAVDDSIPAGAEIDSVRLTLHISTTITGPRPIKLHTATADWGEGASNAPGDESSGTQAEPNDATWGHRFFDAVTWTTPGGDFKPTASAQISPAAPGFYTWRSAQMNTDVQEWLDAPAGNFGWVVLGDEGAVITTDTVKRFDSRAHPTLAFRPNLRVYYTVNP